MKKYRFDPVGMDLWDRRSGQPAPGDIVIKVQPHGCPKNGTMGHCFVAPPDNPRHYALILEDSLQEVTDAETA